MQVQGSVPGRVGQSGRVFVPAVHSGISAAKKSILKLKQGFIAWVEDSDWDETIIRADQSIQWFLVGCCASAAAVLGIVAILALTR